MEKHDMITIATKVSPEAAARLKNICVKRDITLYDMLQMMCDCMLRYMDSAHNLTQELNQLMAIFDGMNNWDNSISLAEPMDQKRIIEAFYILAEIGKQGHRVVHVKGDANNLFREESYNMVEALEMFVCEAFPTLYRKARLAGVALDTNSVFETMYKLIDEAIIDSEEAENRKQFEDNTWAENATRMPDQDIRYADRRPRTDPTLFD